MQLMQTDKVNIYYYTNCQLQSLASALATIVLYISSSSWLKKKASWILLPSKDWWQKNETGKKIPYLFRISWKFRSKSWSNCLDGPCGSFSQVMEQFFGFSKPISPTYFLTGFHQNWVWRPATCLKMLLKMVRNCSMVPMFGVFWMILLPWNARNIICLALTRYFSQNIGLIPGRSWF